MAGPIKFLSDGDPAHRVGDTQYGGADGLIQPKRGDGKFKGSPESKGGHDLEMSDVREVVGEVAGIVRRAAMKALSPRAAKTGVADRDGEAVDPHTGRVAPAAKNKVGGTGAGELSALKP